MGIHAFTFRSWETADAIEAGPGLENGPISGYTKSNIGLNQSYIAG